MVVAVPAVAAVVQVALDEVIDVARVRHGGVAAIGAVHVVFRVRVAHVRAALIGVRGRRGDLVLVDAAALNAVHVAVMQIVHVAIVPDANVAAALPVNVLVISVCARIHGARCHQ